MFILRFTRPGAHNATVKVPLDTPTNVPATTSPIKCKFNNTSPISAVIIHNTQTGRSLGYKNHKTDITEAAAAAWPDGKDSNERPCVKKLNPYTLSRISDVI